MSIDIMSFMSFYLVFLFFDLEVLMVAVAGMFP